MLVSVHTITTHTHVRVHAHTHTRTCTHAHAHTAQTHTNTHTIHTYTMCVCMYVCVYVYYTYIHTYIHTHVHSHIHAQMHTCPHTLRRTRLLHWNSAEQSRRGGEGRGSHPTLLTGNQDLPPQSSQTIDRRATDSCFALVGPHQCAADGCVGTTGCLYMYPPPAQRAACAFNKGRQGSYSVTWWGDTCEWYMYTWYNLPFNLAPVHGLCSLLSTCLHWWLDT